MNWSHLKTILWLRWRLSRNQWRRGGVVTAVLGVVLVFLGTAGAILGVAGGLALGAFLLARLPPAGMLIAWDAALGVLLACWILGLITELQQSQALDLNHLLHLPVSLKQIFVINYTASHATISLILGVPALCGMVAGLALSRGPLFLLLFPLLAAWVFALTAWTCCLRNWLAAIMVNQRRRRAIVVGITAGFILLAQLPNLFFNLMRPEPDRGPAAVAEDLAPEAAPAAETAPLPVAGLLAVQGAIPPLWVGNGALHLAHGNPAPAALGALGLFGIGALGLMRAYRGAVRFYRGEQSAGGSSFPKAAAARRSRNWLQVSLPGVPQEAAAVALATLRSLTRAPEVKMALLTPVVVLAVFAVSVLGRAPASSFFQIGGPLIMAGVVILAMFGVTQIMANQFGYDRDGFRMLMLLPGPRRHYLLGKTLAMVPLSFGIGLPFLAVCKVGINASVWMLAAGVFQLAAAVLLLSCIGNFVSITAPYRITPGTLKPTKHTLKTMFTILLTHLLLVFALAPVMIPPACELVLVHFSTLPRLPLNLLLSLLLAIAAGVVYWRTLNGLGALLHRREQRILQSVTAEVE